MSRGDHPSNPLAMQRPRLVGPTDDSVTVRVPAKLNLHLAVGRRRSDGFHDLQTVYQAVGLYDEVSIAGADTLDVEVKGDAADGVPTGDDNLAVRAVRAVAALAGREPSVAITIDKGIPVAGGLGGGSADAAAALVAADKFFDARLDKQTLDRLAAGIGSDVPFLLHGGIALGSGRGEIISPVLARGKYHWVLAVADKGLSTPKVYAELDTVRADRADNWEHTTSADGVLTAVRSGDAVALGRALYNDLQDPAIRLRPALGRLIDAGRELGAVGAIISGSGPTVAMLARDNAEAVAIASSLAQSDLCRTVRQATAPVHGAKVL